MSEKTIETTLHHYCFDIRKSEDKAAWETLQGELADMLPRQMHSHSGGSQPINFRNHSEKVTLETSFLFSNQWNEAASGDTKGRRLFDWYLEYRLTGQHIKQGHWLEQTQEMTDIRNNTKKCGYCGHMTTHTEEFCMKCIGSEYLEEKELYMLRYRPVAESPRQFPKLTPKEEALLLPLYETAQGLGKANREVLELSIARKKVAALMPKAESKATELVINAQKETEAYTWLLDNKFRNINNVIYYDHSGKFSFGWRQKYTDEEKVELTKFLEDFPFDWEFHK